MLNFSCSSCSTSSGAYLSKTCDIENGFPGFAKTRLDACMFHMSPKIEKNVSMFLSCNRAYKRHLKATATLLTCCFELPFCRFSLCFPHLTRPTRPVAGIQKWMRMASPTPRVLHFNNPTAIGPSPWIPATCIRQNDGESFCGRFKHVQGNPFIAFAGVLALHLHASKCCL